MSRLAGILVAALVLAQTPALGVVVRQENQDLGTSPGTNWDYIPLTNTIVILTPHTDETFVFWAHQDGEPDQLAEIREITLDPNIDPGTVKLKVSKTEEGITPGALAVHAVTIDAANIQSILEGVSVTGNFLGEAAMTVDQVTGPIDVGGSLLNAVTVVEDLEGAVTILNSIEAGAAIEIAGDVLQPITVGEFVIDRTPTTYDGAVINAPITIQGDLAGTIYVYGHLAAPIHIVGDMLEPISIGICIPLHTSGSDGNSFPF